MSAGSSDPAVNQPEPAIARLSAGKLLIRFSIVALIVGGTAAAFAYTGGWFTPGRLTPTAIVDRFEQINGRQTGFRRNHSKGICFSGHFEANGNGTQICRASVFATGSTPVIGRFALAGGMAYAADTGQTARSMAVDFKTSDGQEWRMGINNIPVFPVNTPVAFFDLLQASAPDPATGKPDPTKIGSFLKAHPETVAAFTAIKASPISSGFANSTFCSLNAFIFKNKDAVSTPVRWAMVPVQPFTPLPATQPAISPDKNYLFDALITEAAEHPLKWKLIVTIGQPGDSTSDATIAWPSDRRTIDTGTLTIDNIEDEAHSLARDINFDPLVLPDGITGSDDPLLSARSAAYSKSFTRREGETRQPSAVSTSQQPSTTGGK